MREFFITEAKKQTLQDSDGREQLKCYICGKEESGRSHLYGHYARSHFKDQLIEQISALIIGAEYCEEHKIVLRGEARRAAHYGRVHNMQSCKMSRIYLWVKRGRPKRTFSGFNLFYEDFSY